MSRTQVRGNVEAIGVYRKDGGTHYLAFTLGGSTYYVEGWMAPTVMPVLLASLENVQTIGVDLDGNIVEVVRI